MYNIICVRPKFDHSELLYAGCQAGRAGLF